MSRSRWWPVTAPLVVGVGLALAAPASRSASPSTGPASTVHKASGTVTLKVDNAPLALAISLLTQQAEVVVANNKELMDRTVTVSLKDRPIEEALDKLLTPSGIPWYRADDGTYMINARRPEPSAISPTSPNLVPEPPAPRPIGKFSIVDKIELHHISPEEAMIALGLPPAGLIWRASKTGFENGIPQLDHLPTNSMPDIRVNGSLSPGNPVNPPANTTSGSSDATVAPASTGAAINDAFNRAPQEHDQYGQFPGGRQPGFSPRPSGIPPTTPGSATGPGGTNANGNAGNIKGFLPAGIELVAGLATDNSLLVQGPPDDIDELRTIVRLLDVSAQQVNIKVDVITVSTSALRQFGAQWQFFTREGNIRAGGANTNVPDGLTFDLVRGNVQAIIGALTTNGRGRVIASPIVATQNLTPATIFQGTSIPIFIPILSQVQGSTLSTYNVTSINATTQLTVIPQINRDGTITVRGSIQVQNVIRLVPSPDGTNQFPETSQTGLPSFVRRVGNGETLVIGGLNQKQESSEETRIPLLADVPLVGHFFRNHQKNISDTQLLIFLTPTVVTEHPGGSDTPP